MARGDASTAAEALSQLCADYYEPVVAFLAREGRTGDAARELAHGFFAELLKGDSLAKVMRGQSRFRSYLLGALKHFISRQREHAARQKRGGGHAHVPLAASTDSSPGIEVAADTSLTPDACFDRQWALTVLARALDSLREEAATRETAQQFERLKPWLTGDADYGDQAALAAELGLERGALKVAIHRLKQRFRAAVRGEISRTLNKADSVETEMRALFSALG